jgi:hypothetical protein
MSQRIESEMLFMHAVLSVESSKSYRLDSLDLLLVLVCLRAARIDLRSQSHHSHPMLLPVLYSTLLYSTLRHVQHVAYSTLHVPTSTT